ncbi:MAG TPA: hypothetical protein VLD67_05375 [Vicinamibacterales bacterium]|nr:hypothetical protein [Vicinamibacterales bacterium]
MAGAEGQSPAQSQGGSGAVLWTVVGAGAGFGIGLWAGLTAFDDAIDSDRKVWTTAILSGVAGGVVGYFIGRRRDAAPRTSTATRPATSKHVVLPGTEAPPLGSGDFRRWLERNALESGMWANSGPDRH